MHTNYSGDFAKPNDFGFFLYYLVLLLFVSADNYDDASDARYVGSIVELWEVPIIMVGLDIIPGFG